MSRLSTVSAVCRDMDEVLRVSRYETEQARRNPTKPGGKKRMVLPNGFDIVDQVELAKVEEKIGKRKNFSIRGKSTRSKAVRSRDP